MHDALCHSAVRDIDPHRRDPRWIFTTWLRVRHGYPLENGWGKAVYPRTSDEATERVRLLGQENAQLRAELASVKDRLSVIERIVTDGSYRLDQEISGLRGPAN